MGSAYHVLQIFISGPVQRDAEHEGERQANGFEWEIDCAVAKEKAAGTKIDFREALFRRTNRRLVVF